MDPYQDHSLRQRLQNTVEYLVGAKPIKERLGFVYTNYLFPLLTENFPEHRRGDFESLKEMFRGGPSRLQNMPDEEAEEWARLIFDLFVELNQGRPDYEPPLDPFEDRF